MNNYIKSMRKDILNSPTIVVGSAEDCMPSNLLTYKLTSIG